MLISLIGRDEFLLAYNMHKHFADIELNRRKNDESMIYFARALIHTQRPHTYFCFYCRLFATMIFLY